VHASQLGSHALADTTMCSHRCEHFMQEHWWVLRLSPASKRQSL
jgi:hypothetical protein